MRHIQQVVPLDAFKQMRWHSYVLCDGPSVFQCSPIGNVSSLKYRIFMIYEEWIMKVMNKIKRKYRFFKKIIYFITIFKFLKKFAILFNFLN